MAAMDELPHIADGVRVETSDRIMRVTLCSPDNRNAQTPALWRRLAQAGEFAAETGIDVVLLAAEGMSFSAGLDRRMFTPEGIPGEGSLVELTTAPDAEIDAAIAQYQHGFSVFTDGPFVSIALVQGHAVGAGFQLALACDLILCGDDAQFSMREASYGLVPDLTGTSRLTRTVGYQRAMDICLTTRWVGAEEARNLGLVVDVRPVAELAAAGDELAAGLAGAVPGTARDMKSLLRAAEIRSPREQRDMERLTQIRRLRTLAELAAAAGS
jgi:enoyl-CoA hydratase/carnithine racemase